MVLMYRKRKLTFNFIGLFWVVYFLQLLTAILIDLDVAVWWFYFQPGQTWPGITLSPGVALSVISHNMLDAKHLIGNSLTLLAVGYFAEPLISKRRYIVILIGLGFLSILSANALHILFGTNWARAGASSGILALLSYVGLKENKLAFEYLKNPFEGNFIGLVPFTGMAFIPVVPLYELFFSGNIGHAMGPILGLVGFIFASYVAIDW